MSRDTSSSSNAPPRNRSTASDERSGVAALGAHLRSDDRGIQWTLESVMAILVLFSALTFAIDAIPAANEASQEQYLQSQLKQNGNDIMVTSNELGDLKNATLHWDATAESNEGGDGDGRFIGAEDTGVAQEYYTVLESADQFPMYWAIDETIAEENIAHNLVAVYETGNNATAPQRMVHQGTPGDGAVLVTMTVTLYDSDVPQQSYTSNDGDECTLKELYEGTNGCAGSDGVAGGEFFAPDASPDTARYNTIKVKLVLWRV